LNAIAGSLVMTILRAHRTPIGILAGTYMASTAGTTNSR